MPEQKKGDTEAAAPVPSTDARTVSPSKKRDNVQKPGPQEDTTLSKNNTLFYYFTSGSVVLFIAIAIGIFFAPQEFFSSRGIDGDIESGNKKDSAAPMDAPPPLKYVHNKEKTTNNDGVQSSTTAKGKAEKRARGDPSCYTLEAYSDTFVVTPEEKRRNKNNERNPMASSYYRCGTRLTDLDSGAVDRTIMELCKSSPTSTSTTAFPSLRVVLMGNTEVNAHTQQRDNVAAQRVPLTRLNDDYCDCLDGTDELQTNACSFAGAVAPLGRARWWRHVTANAHVKLYEEEENATEKRSARLRRRIGGPSLPLRCRSDPHVVIAPSRVNDGVVDCCDGSDESDPIVLKRWREAQSALEGLLERQGSIERSLYGANRTVAAALLEYEFSALLPSCHRVKTERLAAAKALHEIISKGHKLYEQRRASGWESYGKEFVGNQTKLLREMVDLRIRFEKTKQSILERMTEKQARTPMEAGVPKQEIEEMQNRGVRIQSLAMRLQHMDRMLNYECLGKDFVFYPIVEKSYRIPAAQCIDTSYKATGEVAQRLVHQYDAEDGREGASTHVDNVSFFTHYVTPFLHLVGEQLITAEQATELLRLSGSLAPNETLNESSPGYKDMQFVQTHILGYWYPDTTEESLANFSATDPSGGAVLEAQMMIGTHRDDAEQMGGGFGQRLPHERLAVLRRVRRVIQKEKQAPSKDKARKEADGEQSSVEIVVPQQHNSPLGAAVHLFYGGTKCGFDNISLPPKQNGAQSMDNETDDSLFTHSYGRLVYVCAAEDGVLTWYRNGKCAHEILFGTPSECTDWVLRAAEEKLHRAEAAVQQEKQ